MDENYPTANSGAFPAKFINDNVNYDNDNVKK